MLIDKDLLKMFALAGAMDHSTALTQHARNRSLRVAVESALLNFQVSGILRRFAGARIEQF